MNIMSITKDIKEIKNKVMKEKELAKNIGKTLKKNLLISIDLSKTCPGISIYNLEENNFLFLDSFKGNNKLTNHERNLEILYWILEIISKYRPYKAIIESPFISTFTIKSVGPLMKLHGIVDHFLFENGLEIYEISPTSSRSYLKIKPNTKEEAFKFVKSNYPILELETFKKDNDKSDAVVLALNFNNPKLKKIN